MARLLGDQLLAQTAIDRFGPAAFELAIDGDSYRPSRGAHAGGILGMSDRPSQADRPGRRTMTIDCDVVGLPLRYTQCYPAGSVGVVVVAIGPSGESSKRTPRVNAQHCIESRSISVHIQGA